MALDAKQIEVAKRLLTNPSVTSVAKACDVHFTTVYRWLRDDVEFCDFLFQCQKASASQAIRSLSGTAKLALKTLADLMQNAKDERVRMESANSVLDRTFTADIAMRADESSNNPKAVQETGGSESGEE